MPFFRTSLATVRIRTGRASSHRTVGGRKVKRAVSTPRRTTSTRDAGQPISISLRRPASEMQSARIPAAKHAR